jgi:hypothetical protein
MALICTIKIIKDIILPVTYKNRIESLTTVALYHPPPPIASSILTHTEKFKFLLTYSLTELSPSRRAANSAATQELPSIL